MLFYNMKIQYVIYYIDYSCMDFSGAVLSECERFNTEQEAMMAIKEYLGGGAEYTILKVYE